MDKDGPDGGSKGDQEADPPPASTTSSGVVSRAANTEISADITASIQRSAQMAVEAADSSKEQRQISDFTDIETPSGAISEAIGVEQAEDILTDNYDGTINTEWDLDNDDTDGLPIRRNNVEDGTERLVKKSRTAFKTRFLPAFRDEQLATTVVDRMYGVYGRRRAGAGDVTPDDVEADDRWSLFVSNADDGDTHVHEYWHGVQHSYGYGYSNVGSVAGDSPRDLAHHYNMKSNGEGVIKFYFESYGDFRDVEQYMLAPDNGGDNSDPEQPVGWAAWRGDVDEYGSFKANPDHATFEAVETADDAIEWIEPGRLVKIDNDDGDVAIYKVDQIYSEDPESYEASVEFVSGSHRRRPTSVSLEEGGGLAFGMGDDYTVEAVGTYGGATTPPDDGEHPLANAAGFTAKPESDEEKVRNIISGANKAWVRQARESERQVTRKRGEASDVQPYFIGSGYSSTNASETMAKAGEILLTHDDDRAENARELAEYHPELTAAYLEVIEPTEAAADAIRASDAAEEWNLTSLLS